MNDKILMPRRLTAENGAKKLMIGEFFVDYAETCPECEGYGYARHTEEDLCDVCKGEGSQNVRIQVPWSTIKNIYDKAVKHFGEEVKDSRHET